MSANSPRSAAARAIALATIAVLTLLPEATTAQPGRSPDPARPSRPVEELRQTLRLGVALGGLPPEEAKAALAARKAALEKQANAVRGVADLSRALMLPEWSQGQGSDEEANLQRGVRKDLADRFEEAMSAALKGGTPARQCAAVTLLGEMPSASVGSYFEVDPVLVAVITRLLPEAAKLADSKDAGVREATARALGRLPLEPEATSAALGKLLADREAAVRRAAAEGLARLARGYDPPPRAGSLPERTVAARPEVCAAVVPIAARGMKDADEEVRRWCLDAVRGAAVSVGTAIGSRLEIEKPTREERWQPLLPVGAALVDAVPSVVPLVTDKNAAICVRACQALEAIAAARRQLLDLAARFPPPAKGGTEKDALLAGLRKALPALATQAGNKDVEVRLAALYVLEELGPEAAPAAAAAAKAMDDEDSFVRWAAARVLGKMAPWEADKAVPALVRRVSDDNGDVRITALAALERYGPEAAPAVEKVTALLKKGGDEQTRLWAVRVLAAVGRAGREKTAAPLIEALSAKEVTIRRAAAGALAGLGAPDEATTAALRAALKDADGEVRRTASEALLGEK
jgi:HEAT repeat protein